MVRCHRGMDKITDKITDKILADAVLFDLDGTLVDSFELSARWWRDWVGRVGLDWEAISGQVRGRRSWSPPTRRA